MKLFLITIISLIALITPKVVHASQPYWEVQSIDTMKFSRDLARERLKDINFEKTIEQQVKLIARVGATHVAVGTPYDEEFIPYLHKWVSEARKNNLNVWFRGNFSGWEGWFGYGRINRDEHLRSIEKFILDNPSLFEDGDIFTSCTECENGGGGDPRYTGDINGYREFLITEYEISKNAYEQIGKKVDSNYFSMNGDVARLIMDKKTTEALGGIVVIDHYVVEPAQLVRDIIEIGERSGGRIVLGEIGAPIPDIHGAMTEYQQALWIDRALSELSSIESLVGINYWTSFGGTTSIWKDDGTEKPAVGVISGYYQPEMLSGQVVNEIRHPIADVSVIANSNISKTDNSGQFTILKVPSTYKITVIAHDYKQIELSISDLEGLNEIVLEKINEDFIFKFQKWIYNLRKEILGTLK